MSDALRPVAWQYTAESGNEHYTSIKARALQFDANPMPLYAAPPSTAEKCYVCGGNDGIRGKHGIYCERTIIEGRFPWKPSTAEIRAKVLEEFAKKMRQDAKKTTLAFEKSTEGVKPQIVAAEQAEAEAQRIREEG